ncbi:hypothetical protein DL769_009128 [Monosporascus sp. CRB-8-3]|nr:hypothetical protein DL769_009128 [Monosporascus sp. CRB-8-3]
MAATNDKREPSIHDGDANFTARGNAKAFHIRVSPSQFVNSPAMTEKYLEMLRSGEEVIGDIFDTDVLDASWALWGHQIVLSYKNPEDALFKPPCKVLIDDGQTACFFEPCRSAVRARVELHAYKRSPRPAWILGCIYAAYSASYNGGQVSSIPPSQSSIRLGLSGGTSRQRTCLIDQDHNAWITDFGGGYTQDWVDEQMAGTVEGSLADMAKLRQFILQDEAEDRSWTGKDGTSSEGA